MRNAGTGNWKFRIIVLGNGDDFDSDFDVECLGFEVRDIAGNLQTDYVATSASGIDWSLTSVPEPSSVAGGWVALAATAALALRRRVSAPGPAQRGEATPDAAARMRRAAAATRRATS